MITKTKIQLSDFEYALPEERIAQNALPNRTQARLLVLSRVSSKIRHRTFGDIADTFNEGDVLVLNNTKVLPARIFAKRKTGARVEILILERMKNSHVCQVLLKPSGRVRQDEVLNFDSEVAAGVLVLDEADHKTGIRHIAFRTDGSVDDLLARVGKIPLPPYIDREELPVDRELYQTVFARIPGAVASPTAGLHFDEALLGKLEQKGVEIVQVTLHVSYGTFQPVQVEDVTKHKMYEEKFEISNEVAAAINQAKKEGRPVVACGTTVVRTLEASRCESGAKVKAQKGATSLFIYPPYEFKIVDRLITNFHLPKSTLLMLTSAFAGHDRLMQAYEEAIRESYRFYSYGDAMLIL
jgi:S-adenosylmethionine:tRNA ribosyltransferase-isomerase